MTETKKQDCDFSKNINEIVKLISSIKQNTYFETRENLKNYGIFNPFISELNSLALYLKEKEKEQKKLNENLEEKNKFIESIIENIPEAVCIKDAKDNFRIKYWNKAAENLFEISKNEIIGKNTRELWPKEQADLYEKADIKVCQENVIIDIPIEPSITKTRGEICLHTLKIPLRFSNNSEINYLLVICEDITLKRQIQKENEILLTRLEKAQSVAKIGSWEFDLNSYHLYWSKEHYKIFEIEEPQAQENLYTLYRSRIHPEDIVQLDFLVDRAIKNGEGFVFDHRLLFDNGNRIKFVQGIGKILKNNDGIPYFMHGTCQDITREKELENELNIERAKSLHSAKLASLGEMSAGIAHEVNNPLTIISSNLDLLEKYRNDSEKFNLKISTIQKSVERISKIVLGLKKFSRQNVVSNKKNYDLADIVRESIILTESKSKRHLTSVDADFKVNAKIFCDEVEIEQVLINLVNNAIDAVKCLTERWVKINVFENQNFVILQIKDSGLGITPAIEQKMFQPFFTTKPVGYGTGLGLSITKGILDQHNASISINRETKNTCFEIKFPKISGE